MVTLLTKSGEFSASQSVWTQGCHLTVPWAEGHRIQYPLPDPWGLYWYRGVAKTAFFLAGPVFTSSSCPPSIPVNFLTKVKLAPMPNLTSESKGTKESSPDFIICRSLEWAMAVFRQTKVSRSITARDTGSWTPINNPESTARIWLLSSAAHSNSSSSDFPHKVRSTLADLAGHSWFCQMANPLTLKLGRKLTRRWIVSQLPGGIPPIDPYCLNGSQW